jgi:hypothetical protein
MHPPLRIETPQRLQRLAIVQASGHPQEEPLAFAVVRIREQFEFQTRIGNEVDELTGRLTQDARQLRLVSE